MPGTGDSTPAFHSPLAETEIDDEVCRGKLEVEACQASRSDHSLSPSALPLQPARAVIQRTREFDLGLRVQGEADVTALAPELLKVLQSPTARRKKVPTGYVTSKQQKNQ